MCGVFDMSGVKVLVYEGEGVRRSGARDVGGGVGGGLSGGVSGGVSGGEKAMVTARDEVYVSYYSQFGVSDTGRQG